EVDPIGLDAEQPVALMVVVAALDAAGELGLVRPTGGAAVDSGDVDLRDNNGAARAGYLPRKLIVAPGSAGVRAEVPAVPVRLLRRGGRGGGQHGQGRPGSEQRKSAN